METRRDSGMTGVKLSNALYIYLKLTRIRGMRGFERREVFVDNSVFV